MLKKKKTKTENPAGKNITKRKSVPSLISDDMNILGNLISDGYVDINGHIEGNVKCESLTVRDNGMVKGDVFADMVQVYGQVSGIIKARHVLLASTARVRGVVMHESMSVEDGAFIDGQCKRTDRSNIMENDEEGDLDMSDESNLDLIENFRVITEQAN